MRCARNPKETIDYHNDSRCLKTEEFSKRVFQKDLYWNVRNPKDTVNSFSRYPQVSWRLKNFEKSLFKKIFINKMDFRSIKNVNIVCTHYLIYNVCQINDNKIQTLVLINPKVGLEMLS